MFIHFWNYTASIVITYKSVSKRSHTFITVITWIRIFSLNLGIFNKNLETTKYSLERYFQKEWEHQKKKKKSLKFFRKRLGSKKKKKEWDTMFSSNILILSCMIILWIVKENICFVIVYKLLALKNIKMSY